MSWQKSSPELIAKFDAALPADARVERRQMFGYPCAFVQGNMFTGVHQENIVVRLSEEGRSAAAAEGARPFVPMPGRIMQEWVALPQPVIDDAAALRGWVQKAFVFVSALPEKAKGKTKAAKAKASKPGPSKAAAKKNARSARKKPGR